MTNVYARRLVTNCKTESNFDFLVAEFAGRFFAGLKLYGDRNKLYYAEMGIMRAKTLLNQA